MASVKCPECGERVKLRDDGKKLRCPECGEKFHAPDDDEDEEQEEEERPRSRSKRKEPAKKSSKVMITAIIVGGVLMVAVIGLVVVLIVRGKGGGGTGTDSAKVTPENFQRVKPGMDLAEVEGILGGSRSSSEDDMRDAFRRGTNEIQAAWETGWSRFGEGTEWRRWEGKDFRVWVVFAKTKEGKRASFSTALEKTGNTHKPHQGFSTFAAGDFGHDLDEMNAQRKKEDAVRNDPKWVRGAPAQSLVAGDWRKESADGMLFGSDGVLTEDNSSSMMFRDKKITYRVVDDKKLEITYPSLFNPPPPMPGQPPPPVTFNPVTRTFEYFVTQDEMVLIEVTPHAHIARIEYHTYYRMPARPGSPGDTKLIAPLIAAVKGNDVNKRSLAFYNIRRMGKGAAPTLPALREVATTSTDKNVRNEAEGLVRSLEGKKP